MDRYCSPSGASSLSPSVAINSSPVISSNKKAFSKSPMICLIRASVRPTPPSSPSAISNSSPFSNKSMNAVEQLKQLSHNKVKRKRKREHSSTGIVTRSKIKRRLTSSMEETTNASTSTSDSLTNASNTAPISSTSPPIFIANSNSTSPAASALTSVSPSINSALPSASTSVSSNIPTCILSSFPPNIPTNISSSASPNIQSSVSTSISPNIPTSISSSASPNIQSSVSTSVSPNIPASISSSVSAPPSPRLFHGKQCFIRLPLMKKPLTKLYSSVPRLCVEKLKNIPSFVDKGSTGTQSPMSLSTLLSHTPPAKPSRLSLPITRSSKVKSVCIQRHSASSSVLCPSSSPLVQQQGSSSSPQTRSPSFPVLLSLPASPSGSLSSSSSIPHSQLSSHQNSPTPSLSCPVSVSITKDQVTRSRGRILKRSSLNGSASGPSHIIGRGSSRQFGNTSKVSGGGPVNKDTGTAGASGRGGRAKRNSDSFNGDSQSSDERRPKKRRGVVSDDVRPPNIVDWSCALCNLGNNASELSYLYGPLNNVNNRTEDVWTHWKCAVWASGVYFDGDELKGLSEAIEEGQSLVCCKCNKSGATIICHLHSCKRPYHYPCAVQEGCHFNQSQFIVTCPAHSTPTDL
ncbi:PREDICTED: uncharacterized threonine-rich GPI-anchored glycoprotein PJ4664.02-like [Amphimedon queenslandica]|uniref:PHD-type domain-containing protein n=1 Tax=Amphimedon queenslandica TaxID=400682 RepID=A0A1X7SWW6_AMPQE|nr:PREDICTED: uncharacterized threonine-rich GPI-anchored glycoprotein PJ4664.02-like [Amphimedon queenslandica]|eukprot:XP_011408679.2 PREDICTED: uncharacterized threonine-rich GPI-anchored glycoprotein PJ4664.02-like [Amphimedon queenslandica]